MLFLFFRFLSLSLSFSAMFVAMPEVEISSSYLFHTRHYICLEWLAFLRSAKQRVGGECFFFRKSPGDFGEFESFRVFRER